MKTFGSHFLSRFVFYTLKYKKDGAKIPLGPCYTLLFQAYVSSEIQKPRFEVLKAAIWIYVFR